MNRYTVEAIQDVAEEMEMPPIPPSLAQPLADALREGFADADADRVVPGDVVFAELRRMTGRGSEQSHAVASANGAPRLACG